MEKVKIIYFSKTIAALGIKVGRCIELNYLMNYLMYLHEYQRSMSLFYLLHRSLHFQTSIFFFLENCLVI